MERGNPLPQAAGAEEEDPTAAVSCSFSMLNSPLGWPQIPHGGEQHWVNGRRERKALAVIHCPWKEGYD